MTWPVYKETSRNLMTWLAVSVSAAFVRLYGLLYRRIFADVIVYIFPH